MKLVLIFFSLLSVELSAQYLFDFEIDGSDLPGSYLEGLFLQLPQDRWEISSEGAISDNFSLHHSYDNEGTGCDFCLIMHDPLEMHDSLTISFRIRHGYPPSSSNNWQVAILSSLAEGGNEEFRINNGLILGVNYEGADDMVKVWRCLNGVNELICTSTLNYQEKIGPEAAPLFILVCKEGGLVNLYYAPDPPDESRELIGSCQLDQLPLGRSMTIRYEYTSARDRGLWLDDIRLDGNFVADRIAPWLKTLSIIDKRRIQLWFSEHVLIPGNSSLTLHEAEKDGNNSRVGSVFPDQIERVENSLIITFPFEFHNRIEQGLQLTGICDGDGNCMADTVVRFMRNDAVWGDLVFTEVMADPEPVVRLSAHEYLEIRNRSVYPLDLENWHIHVNDRIHLISGIKLGPKEFSVIRNLNLPNNGGELGLFSEDGTLIHGARYAIPWQGPDWKKEGGWSLESPDPELECNTSQLWTYSVDRDGGTPGRINSNDAMLEDRNSPVFLYMGIMDTGIIRVWFSEPILLSPGMIKLNPGGVIPDSIVYGVPVPDYFDIHLPSDQIQMASFELEIESVTDCEGNYSQKNKIRAGPLSVPVFGSPVINEIMYDPFDWAPAYIELYNPGTRFYDLRDLALDITGTNEQPDHPIPLSTHSRIMGPGEYLVVTRNNGHLMDAYGLGLSGRLLESGEMPGFPGTTGSVHLIDRSGATVDRVQYDDLMHMELLDDTKGISLERIHSGRPGSDRDNWHSAASIEGYATPGRTNSQSVKEADSSEILELEPMVFSPDNDGFEDLLNIKVSTGRQGNVIRIWITDLSGNMIRVLANNHIAGPSTNYTWDGEKEDGNMATEGFYVVHLLEYDPSTGHKSKRKAATGLIYR